MLEHGWIRTLVRDGVLVVEHGHVDPRVPYGWVVERKPHPFLKAKEAR